MTGTLLQATIIVTVAMLVYAVLKRGLFLATEQIRFSALELANQLLDDVETPARMKARIEHTLGELHSTGAAWSLAFLSLKVLVSLPFTRWWRQPRKAEVPPHLEPLFSAYVNRWTLCTIANSPAAALVFILATIFTLAVTNSASALSKVLLSDHEGHRGDGGSSVPTARA